MPKKTEHAERILELTRQGLTAPVIADMLDIAQATVHRHRTRAGIGVKTNFASEDEKLRAKQMLVDGCSYEEVARTLGRYGSTIAGWHPGFQFTPAQIGAASAMSRKMKKVERSIKTNTAIKV